MKQINGRVDLPKDHFFKMAKADYRNYGAALWREIYQNSIDAGATNIDVTWDETERSITVVDNGCGMNLETLTTKLLVLGGSEKAEGSTGAFGKAKELELFSWEKYVLQTRDLLLMGSGADYTINQNSQDVDGTSITIYIQEDVDFDRLTDYAVQVAKKIEVPSCTITVDGRVVQCTSHKGGLVKTLPSGSIYVDHATTRPYAEVRIHGIWMFDLYVGHESPSIIFELSGDSIASLTSNRDGLKGTTMDQANQFFQRLASDRVSALHPEKEMVRYKVGSDRVQLSNDDMEFISQLQENLGPIAVNKTIANLIADLGGSNDQRLTIMRLEKTAEWDPTRLAFVGYGWDTVHQFEESQREQALGFIETKKADRWLTMWGETLKQIFLDIGVHRQFTIGFSWDSSQQAHIQKTGDHLTFRINPEVLGRYEDGSFLPNKIRQLAIHEVSHLDRDYHDEMFVGASERTAEATWYSEKEYQRIAKLK